jgi:hypothetical protein
MQSKVTISYSKSGNVAVGTKRGTTVWFSGKDKSQTVRVDGDKVTVGGKRVN